MKQRTPVSLVLSVVLALAALGGGAGCKRAAGPNTNGAKERLAAFTKPGADALAETMKLRPQPADYDAVFVGDAAQKAKGALEPVWDTLKGGLKPTPDQTQIDVFTATADDLKKGDAHCPGGYKDIADKINPKVVLYCFRFVKPGENTGTHGDGQVFVNDHWAMFPKAFKAFK